MLAYAFEVSMEDEQDKPMKGPDEIHEEAASLHRHVAEQLQIEQRRRGLTAKWITEACGRSTNWASQVLKGEISDIKSQAAVAIAMGADFGTIVARAQVMMSTSNMSFQ